VTLPAGLLEPFAALMNRAVAGSTPARRQCQRLEGRSFGIIVVGGAEPLRLILRVQDGRLSLVADDAPTDASVTGTPLALLAMMAPRANLAVRGSGVRIEGDAETAQAFRDLLSHAHPDLEAEAARYIGEAPAHRAMRMVRGLAGFGRQAIASFAANSAEYLTEESAQLPPRAEVDGFMDEVDRLREAVDRAEARLRLLESRRGPGPRP